MADYRKILGLLLEGRSYREVVEIAGCSHRDVARVRHEAQERGLTSAVAITDADRIQLRGQALSSPEPHGGQRGVRVSFP